MRSVILFIGLFFLLPVYSDGQEGADFNRINNETYRLYLEEQWDSVVLLGKEAFKQEIDYYYLRMRIGIAYYHKKNYRVAATHFMKALEMNQGDQAALEYLYYARLMAGQGQQASAIRSRFTGELATRLPRDKGRFFKSGGIEYLYAKSNFSNPDEIPGEFYSLPEGALTVPLHFSNYSVSLENGLAPGISLAHAYTFLAKDNYYYQNEGTGIFYLMDKQHVVQHQYYLSPRFTTRSGLTLLPMVHLISAYYQAILSSAAGGGGYMGGAGTNTVGYVKNIDLAGGMTMVKNWRRLDLSAGAALANLNGVRQFQGRFGITWYPLGNLNLYAGAGVTGQREWSDFTTVSRWVPDLKVGVAVAEKVWIEANAAIGEMHNFLERNGSIIYNGYSDILERKAILSLLIPVTGKGSLIYLGGRWTSGYNAFIPESDPLPEADQLFQIQTFSIYGGLSWKF